MADSLPEMVGEGTDKFRAGKAAAKANHKRSLRIYLGKISAHRVNLSFDGVTRHCPFGPAFGNHRTDPHVLPVKQSGGIYRFDALQDWTTGIKPVPVQGKVRCFCNDGSSQNGLELRPGFKPLHWCPASVRAQKYQLPAENQLRQPDVCGLWRGGQRSLRGHRGFSCVSGNRGYGRA